MAGAHDPVLEQAHALATAYLGSLATRPVGATGTLAQLRALADRPLTDDGVAATEVLRDLDEVAQAGVVACAGPRYFGFVIGGSYPVALGADWLVSTWDQNPGLHSTSPFTAVVEEVAARWVLELTGLPSEATVGFTTGCQMASFTALAAARHKVLADAGWDVEADGLQGAPPVDIVMGAEAHVTIHTALRYLGFGLKRARLVGTDGEGRMIADELRRVLDACRGPTIVCAQAGNVNTGSFDPIEQIAAETNARGAWLHIDGAFGLWARASPRHAHLARGIEQADSWATDAHKWLNVPYDCGIVIARHGAAHRSAMAVRAAYLEHAAHAERDAFEYVPEFSRRARSVPVYAVLRHLGRRGVAELVERCCAHARRFAQLLGAEPGVAILNDVVLNQVLVRFGDSDEATRDVIARVQRDGTCWLGGTTWHGLGAMRISVSNWSTAEDDVERSAAAILAAYRAIR
ncbi:MAG TPA: pyridoxal-dependent decarboxylase [Xanthomonadales bacterium]|nr:pyridoxal-dependent decarboxylase [Xanthomonadales bacterium]